MSQTETQIVNIDSRFRSSPQQSSSTDFVVNLPTPIKNVKSIRLSTEEIPNVFYAFNNDSSTILQVREGPDPSDASPYTHQTWSTLFIDPGNYDAATLSRVIRDKIGNIFGFPQTTGVSALTGIPNRGFDFQINSQTGNSTVFLNKQSFEYINADLCGGGVPVTFEINFTPVDLNKVYTYAVNHGAFIGISNEDRYITEIDIYSQAIRSYATNLMIGEITLRDILGFSDFLFYGKDTYTSTGFINTNGYQYLLLDVNNYDTLTHISQDNEMNVFAKIPLTVAKTFTSIGSVSRTIARPKIFDQPETIRQFRIRLFDILGNIVDLKRLNISITFEIEYYRTQKGYDNSRNALLPTGEITSFSSAASRTSSQQARKEQLRNIVFQR